MSPYLGGGVQIFAQVTLDIKNQNRYTVAHHRKTEEKLRNVRIKDAPKNTRQNYNNRRNAYRL